MPALIPSRAVVVPLVGVLALSLAACGGDGPRDDGPCATALSTADATARPIPLAQATVELLSGGDAPQSPLRAAPDRTSPQRVRATATTTVLSRVAGQTDDEAASREDQSVTLALTARRHCTDEKDAALRLDEVSSTDAALSGDLGKDSGSRGGLTLGDGHVPVSLRLWPNRDASTTARAVVENTLATALQNIVALPDQPVGPGATWRVTRTVLGATTLHQTVTAVLTSRSGDVADIDVTVDESPTGSDYTVPGTAKTLQIARYSALGRGSVRLDLRRVLPIDGSLDVRGARELVGADAAKPLVQQTRYQLSWSR
ncbi:hypothetical protein [Gordonia sp. (in: high G+C Gram-positive bacteria)]|uniref:hypothetical protein n=1 Tax=Gordonia sp. (in: high G+C Gram-positive bacteria) TaxID=84139 RepID=UPI0039E26646